MSEKYGEIIRGVRLLAGVCDGAVAEDGQGFNGRDALFGHSLAAIPAEAWTPKRFVAAYKMLRTYKAQLSRLGVDYDAIPQPELDELERERRERRAPVASPKTMRLVKGAVEIRFAYDAELVAAVKALPARRFVNQGSDKFWIAPLTSLNAPILRGLIESGFEADAAVESGLAAVAPASDLLEASIAKDADLDAIEGLRGELMPFQRGGVAYGLKTKRCFLADDMGLGKTVQALAAIQAAGAYPAVVVCPAAVKLNWRREAESWIPGLRVAVLSGRDGELPTADLYIINYDILGKPIKSGKRITGWTGWINRLATIGAKAVVLDESQYVKSHDAARTQACLTLAKGVPMRLALSGTPLMNRPAELIAPLRILGRFEDIAPSWKAFVVRYCDGFQDRFGWNITGASNLQELNEKLRSTCYIRRRKSEVLTELPPKRIAEVWMEIDNRTEYDKAARDIAAWVGEQASNDRDFLDSVAGLDPEELQQAVEAHKRESSANARQAEVLVRITKLKQLAAKGKLPAIQEWVQNLLDSGEKLVLFAWHQEIVNGLAEIFGCPRIHGGTSLPDREAAVQRFATDPDTRLIVLNIQAGGTGINGLQGAASNVAFVELGWTPASHRQAEDRLHRIGQTAKTAVTCWYLLAENTIDAWVWELLDAKEDVVDAVADGADRVKRQRITAKLIRRLMKAAA